MMDSFSVQPDGSPMCTLEAPELGQRYPPILVCQVWSDGRFVLYVSDESGKSEIYVRAFPEGGRSLADIEHGGSAQRWRRDGGEIFYQ
jgi:hypothetical protein